MVNQAVIQQITKHLAELREERAKLLANKSAIEVKLSHCERQISEIETYLQENPPADSPTSEP